MTLPSLGMAIASGRHDEWPRWRLMPAESEYMQDCTDHALLPVSFDGSLGV
jgi:hypothetical protein